MGKCRAALPQPGNTQTAQTKLTSAVQLVAVKHSGKHWIARRLKHSDIEAAAHELAKQDQSSLSFARLEQTSGLLWIETDSQQCPQVMRDVVPRRSVSWCTQVVPCDAVQAQAPVPSPLVGALSLAIHLQCGPSASARAVAPRRCALSLAMHAGGCLLYTSPSPRD